MVDSPYITKELRDYVTGFKIEELVSQGINEVARNMPADPYSFLAGFFANLSEEPPTIKEIHAREVHLETGRTLEVTVECKCKGLELKGPGFMLGTEEHEEEIQVEEVLQLNETLRDQEATNQRKIDSLIGGLSYTAAVTLSHACVIAAGYFRKVPLYLHVFEKYTRREWEGNHFPKVLMSLLHTGKAVGSKVKFTKFYVCESHSHWSAQEKLENFRKVFDCCKKILGSSKGGEASIRMSGGAFIPNCDTITECLKILDDSVNQAGLRTGEDVCLAIDCNADDYYNSESEKYEMEGFKSPLESNQLGDYYEKLMNERPYIAFIQDPFATKDLEGWKDFTQKHPNRKVATQRLCTSPQTVTELPEGWAPNLVNMHYQQTFTEMVDLAKAATKSSMGLIVRENPVETQSTYLAHLATGFAAEYLEVSPPFKFQHISKYNEIFEIKNSISNS